MSRNFVIIANGSYPVHPVPLNALNQADVLVACDGAAETLTANGICPDHVVGDLDSLNDDLKKQFADRLIHEYPEYEARVTILGHLQRGGVPTANDRILASRLGVAAIEALKDGQRNIMVGVKNDQIVYVPFNKAIRIDKPIDRELINVLNVLSI